MARKAKSKKAMEPNPKLVAAAIFGIGLFAVVFAVVEGFILKSTAVYTGARGTFTMDPITSSLLILGGLVGMGFGVWCWLNPGKKL